VTTPTKKLTKGGVKDKRETTYPVRTDHSWVRNALLEMVNGGTLTLTRFLSRRNSLTFWNYGLLLLADYHIARLPIQTDVGRIALRQLNIQELRSLQLMPLWIFFLGGVSLSLKVSTIREGGSRPFNAYSGICLTGEEQQGKRQGSRVVREYTMRRPGRPFTNSSDWLLSISRPRLLVGDFSTPFDNPSAYKVAELRGSPPQLIFSRNSPSYLWNTEIPNPQEFAS
jgi:hypothetical protein